MYDGNYLEILNDDCFSIHSILEKRQKINCILDMIQICSNNNQ